jgi:hypothetical protein
LSESHEEEPFDFSFLEDASTLSLSFDEEDLEESVHPRDAFHTPPFYEDEEDYISPQFLEPTVEFESEGNLEQYLAEVVSSPTDLPAAYDDAEVSLPERIIETTSQYLSFITTKLIGFPLRKISMPFISLGLLLILFSFGVKVFEPDYEANKKAAGVVDLYDWIIMNDLATSDVDTDDLFDLWEDTSEYHQFWYWFDHEWTPKISGYNQIKSTLRTVGGFLLGPGIILLLIPVLSRNLPFANKENVETYPYENINKISLNFTTYNTDWSIVNTWAKKYRFKILEEEGTRRLYRKKNGFFRAPILCLISRVKDQVQLEVWVSTRIPTLLIPLLTDLGLDVLEDKDAIIPSEVKELINKLLIQLGHPPIS